MKKLISICLILFWFVSIAYGGPGYTVVGGSVPVAGDTYSDIVFWLNLETGDNTDPYTMGSSECAADSTGSFGSAVAINSTTPLVGTYDLSIPTSADYLAFTINTTELGTSGRLGFYVKIATWGNNASFFSFRGSTTNLFYMVMYDSDEVRVYWYDGASKTWTSSGTNTFVVDTLYFIEVAWDSDADYMQVWKDGNSIINSTATAYGAPSTTPDTLRVGEGVAGGATIYKMDQFMISTDKTRNLYNLRDEAVCPNTSCAP